jgi:hypothetical protein
MQVTVSTSDSGVLEYMRKGQQSIRFAAANALRTVALRIQKAERAHAEQVFRLRPRGGAFIKRQVAVIPKPWPSGKGSLSVTIKVGEAPRLLLQKFETGEAKLPQPGRSAIAIPKQGTARPTFSANVPARFFIESFQLAKQGQRILGKKRTFVEPGRGIFQQQPGKAPPILLYLFKHEARLDRRLRFIPIATGLVPTFYQDFAKEVEKAIAFKFEHYGDKAFNP